MCERESVCEREIVCMCVCVRERDYIQLQFRLFVYFANFLFFFDYNTDFGIFDYFRDWFFKDLSVTHLLKDHINYRDTFGY